MLPVFSWRGGGTMFVVRVENDEATSYRAFRRSQTARAWAAERNGEDVDCLVDVFETSGLGDDPRGAIAAVRAGNAREILRGEALAARPPVTTGASDIDFGVAVAV
ncbi:hypothetical protein [Aureimonas leprariae]|uniref:Uncharacterized protein n=1 Tax=Plantimonas leprariae TaxID=2615207 RepID=A0A7V7PQP3_9HYPH|nr:hypothetical protein [Aureimonas leprariae]KAB0680721.1 hypothetical protein F6X38_06870 [Aureimonas leprariae]